jgi:hypothetical protein
MMMKGTNMITTLSGGAFELRTGRKWTWGFSMFRDMVPFKIDWVSNTDTFGGRWFFEINGVQYSATKISPFIEGIQMHK